VARKKKKSFKLGSPVKQHHFDRAMRNNPQKMFLEASVLAPFREELIFGLPVAIVTALFGYEVGILAALISGIYFIYIHRTNHARTREYVQSVPTYAMQAFIRSLIVVGITASATGFFSFLWATILAMTVHSFINTIAISRKWMAGHFG